MVAIYAVSLSLVTGISLCAWLLVLLYFDPSHTGYIGPALFVLTFLVTLFGSLALIGYLMPLLKDKSPESRLATFIKYSGAATGLVGIVLVMQIVHVLTWWTALILCVIVGLLFLARRPKTDKAVSKK
jgi:hypothetical protein